MSSSDDPVGKPRWREPLVVFPRPRAHAILVIAHRGLSGRYPENTRIAFARAIDCGADMIELDVTFTKDREIVVIHDDTLDRTTNGSGAVEGQTWEQIRALDAGSWFSPEFAGERIPKLGEVLELARGRITINVEIKREAVTDSERGGIEDACITLIRDLGMSSSVIFSSFDERAVVRCRRMAPEIPAAFLSHHPGEGQPVRTADLARATAFHVNGAELTPEIVREAHEARLPVNVYTVNRIPDYERAMAAGVDGIFTDFPERLIAFLEGCHIR